MALTVPQFSERAFHCPHCGVYSHQIWQQLYHHPGDLRIVDGLMRAVCAHCHDYSLWLNGYMVYPDKVVVAPPNPDMEEQIREDYQEAASIVSKSPRGAAGLLRLCIQKLCKQLGEKGENLNEDIANLVRKGLPVQIQQSLDIVRVIGNHTVHPGQIDIRDDQDTAFTLFTLINLIADNMISEPKRIAELYGSLPKKDKENIEKRDKLKGPDAT